MKLYSRPYRDSENVSMLEWIYTLWLASYLSVLYTYLNPPGGPPRGVKKTTFAKRTKEKAKTNIQWKKVTHTHHQKCNNKNITAIWDSTSVIKTHEKRRQATPKQSRHDTSKPIIPVTFKYRTSPIGTHSHCINIVQFIQEKKQNHPL